MPKEAKGGQRVLQTALADVRLWLKSRSVTSLACSWVLRPLATLFNIWVFAYAQ